MPGSPQALSAPFSLNASWLAKIDDPDLLEALGANASLQTPLSVWRRVPRLARLAAAPRFREAFARGESVSLLLPLEWGQEGSERRTVFLNMRWTKGTDGPAIEGTLADMTEVCGVQDDVLHMTLQRSDAAVDELHHGMRNLMSVVISLLGMSSRYAGDVQDYADRTIARVRALDVAHAAIGLDASRFVRRGDIDVERLLQGVIETLGPAARRVTLAGPSVRVPPSRASALALITHELATNAERYGALGLEEGRVEVTWRSTGNGVEVTWVEEGRPVDPSRFEPRFGMTIMRRIAEEALGGRIDWQPCDHGLVIKIFGTLQ